MKRSVALLSVSSIFLAAPALAASPGFIEHFTPFGLGGFGSGGSSVFNAGGYLEVENPLFPIELGAVSVVANLVGNLPADGVGGYSFFLSDVGANDNHEIHVGVGIINSNFWLNTQGFAPPDGSWQQFWVDITDPSHWVQIRGTGTFADALAASNRLLFRHDVAPFVQFSDFATGDFGLDRIEVLADPPKPSPLELIASAASIRPGDPLTITVTGESKEAVDTYIQVILAFVGGAVPSYLGSGPWDDSVEGDGQYWQDDGTTGTCGEPTVATNECVAASAFVPGSASYALEIDLLPSTLSVFQFDTTGLSPGTVLKFRAFGAPFFNFTQSEELRVNVLLPAPQSVPAASAAGRAVLALFVTLAGVALHWRRVRSAASAS